MTTEHYADARKRMVDSQLRPNKVTDSGILAAMRNLPREAFVPANASALAYSDEDIPLGNGRAMLEPMVLARLLQAAEPHGGQQALVVAAGTGYGAAVLAMCGVRVVAVEEDDRLLSVARTALAAHAPGVQVVQGKIADGAPSGGPYDIVVIEGAVPDVPASIVAQLRPDTGKLVAIVTGPGRTNRAVVGSVGSGGFKPMALFDCGTPVLPSLKPAPAFVF